MKSKKKKENHKMILYKWSSKCAHQTFIIQYLDVLTLQLGMNVIEKKNNKQKNRKGKKKVKGKT
jgi:hypothetical protein